MQGASEIRAMFEEGARLKSRFGAENVFDFSIGNPDPPPPETVRQTLRQLLEAETSGVHGYTSNAGLLAAREKIAGNLKCDGLTADHIVLTCGASGALNVILKALLNPGDEVIVLSPYFVEYLYYIDNHGGKAVIVPTDQNTFQPDLAALAAALTPRTKAVLLNSPHNPTGVVYGEDVLRQMAALLGETIYLISDEPYREIVYDGVTVPSVLRLFGNAIVAYSYSKSLSLPGERIGYIAVSPNCTDLDLLLPALIFANRTLGFVNAPALFQRMIAEAPDVAVDARLYQERRDLLWGHLTSLGFACQKPQGAFYLFPKCPMEDGQAFKQLALKYRILLVPGSGFGCPTHFRLAYCVSADTIKCSLPAWTALAGERGMRN